MPTSAFNKFNATMLDVGLKKHNFSSDVLKLMLTNVAPVATNAVLVDITEITPQNGYVAGGLAVTGVTWTQSGGLAKLIATTPTFVASGGSFGPWRYVVFYNSTAAGGPLLGWYDNGASRTQNPGDTLAVPFDMVNGVFTIQ